MPGPPLTLEAVLLPVLLSWLHWNIFSIEGLSSTKLMLPPHEVDEEEAEVFFWGKRTGGVDASYGSDPLSLRQVLGCLRLKTLQYILSFNLTEMEAVVGNSEFRFLFASMIIRNLLPCLPFSSPFLDLLPSCVTCTC